MHGGDIYSFDSCKQKRIIDFSANINPLGMPEGIKKAVVDSIQQVGNYPDPCMRSLREAIAKVYDLSTEQVVVGSGADDLIYRLAYSISPDRVLIAQPTFTEYERSLENIGTEIISYNIPKTDFVIREDILDMIDGSVDAIYICNPNNPTGALVSRALLMRILRKAKQVKAMLILDESFLDFVTDYDIYSMAKELHSFSNLLILKSFTKMYGIPGLRIGYLLCGNTDLNERIMAAGPTWAVSTVAQAAGLAAIREIEFRNRTVCYIDRQRRYLEESLNILGIKYVHGHANYIFMHLPGTYDLRDRLLEHDILIRACDDYVGLDKSYYRIAIKSHRDNVKLIECLKICLKR